jgi:23S rRNA pseudouridine1911/1915/1917 synthase
VDGVARPRAHRLRGGERIEVDSPDTAALAAELPPLPVRFEDDRLLVIAKPAGLVTHPTSSRRSGTVVNRLLGMGVPLSALGGALRPGIVHRLDVGTSGLMLVAKDDDVHRRLAEMLKAHAIDRRYLALVRGGAPHDRFTVDAPLGRRGARVGVLGAGGREAQTSFAVRERLERATLLEAAPRTGRTHQIRVHLSAVGLPIVGDRRYGGGSAGREVGLDRPFLHSWRVRFEHPTTGRPVEVEEPLPEDLERALEIERRSR